MSDLTLTQKLRSSHVMRWHMVRTARQQSVAEHSYRVYLIVQEIAGELELDTYEIAESLALWHDLPEVVLGDVPTPTKRLLGGMGEEEAAVDQNYSDLMDTVDEYCPEIFALVKMADLAESIDFLRTEGIGARAREICAGIRESYTRVVEQARIEHPSFNWDQVEKTLGEIL